MSPTDLSDLRLPPWATPRAPRATAVAGQAVAVPAAWWRHAITSRSLPGTPPPASLTRADVWRQREDVCTLLWHALAWGAGRFLRQNAKRLTAIAEDLPRAGALLAEAASLAGSDPEAAFAVLRPDRHNAIGHLGPSFFTKFLYFTGGGAPDHPSLILDRRVATALREHCGWTSLNRMGPWPPWTYGRYCALLRRWSTDLSCAPDEIELVLFRGRP